MRIFKQKKGEVIKLKKIATVVIAFIGAANAIDSRYKIYGQEKLYNQEIGFRNGSPGYNAGGDIITVGKLDGNPNGPFSLISSDEAAITARWAFLREAPESQVKFDFKGSLTTTIPELRDELLASFILFCNAAIAKDAVLGSTASPE